MNHRTILTKPHQNKNPFPVKSAYDILFFQLPLQFGFWFPQDVVVSYESPQRIRPPSNSPFADMESHQGSLCRGTREVVSGVYCCKNHGVLELQQVAFVCQVLGYITNTPWY